MGNLLSIIISNKDHGHFLPRQLESIVSQTVPPDEVILIDDGSSDNSKELMRNFKSDNPQLNVRLFLHKENMGAIKRCGEALMVTASKFVYFGASDDYLLPDFVKEQKQAIALNDTRIKIIASANYSRGGFVTPEEFSASSSQYIPGHGSIIDRQTLIEFGGLNPVLDFHTDWFVSHAIVFTNGFFAIPRELSVHTVRNDSYAHTPHSQEKEYKIFCEMIRVLTEEKVYSECRHIMAERCVVRFDKSDGAKNPYIEAFAWRELL